MSSGATSSAVIRPAGPRSAVPGSVSKEGATAGPRHLNARRPVYRTRSRPADPRQIAREARRDESPSTRPRRATRLKSRRLREAHRSAPRVPCGAPSPDRGCTSARDRTSRDSGSHGRSRARSRPPSARAARRRRRADPDRARERRAKRRVDALGDGRSSRRARSARRRAVSALVASSRHSWPISPSHSRIAARSHSSSGRTMRPR